MFTPINAAKNLILIMFSFTIDIYCTSVRPGRGIPHMWLSLRFLLSFYLLKGVFSSFSLLLLRVKGRGCHTLLKPYETNCGWWIWAIQIKTMKQWNICLLPPELDSSLSVFQGVYQCGDSRPILPELCVWHVSVQWSAACAVWPAPSLHWCLPERRCQSPPVEDSRLLP